MASGKLKIGGEEVQITPGFLANVPVDGKTSRQVQNEIKIATGSHKLPLQLANSFVSNEVSGRIYPGRVSFPDMRALARSSTVVRSIIIMRSQQVSKLPIKIIPKKKEPIRQTSILKYSSYDLEDIPCFDENDVVFLRDIFDRVDEDGFIADKRKKYKELKASGDVTPQEIAAVEHLQNKHDEFYKKRVKDKLVVEKILNRPDPYFTESPTWNSLINKVLDDVLILDRGVLVKIRDTDGNIQGLMPVDASTIKPVINEFGYIDDDKSYVQEIRGIPKRYLSKDDVIVITMNPVTDINYFGYGISPMETLYMTVMSDLFIDKGNYDYYRKGGTIPEGMITIEPPANKEGIVSQMDQESLEAIQRQLTSIMQGDFTQVPIVSGGKIGWIDFKGSRRDMQFKELAEYLVRKICAVYQVSPQDVGILEGMKTSDGQVQADLTKSKGLQTIMSVISEFITEAVINEIRPESDLKLWYEEEQDKEADKTWGTQAKAQAGVYSINEIRAEEGKPPVPWGNTPLAAGNQKNWEAPAPQGAPGAAPGGLPPLPGLPPPPMGNAMPPPMPGAAPGGAPAAPGGAPPPQMGAAPAAPPVMKSFFEQVLDKAKDAQLQTDFIDGTDWTPVVDMFMKGVKLPEDDALDEIANYTPSSKYKLPIDSYTDVLKSINSPLEIDVRNPEEDTILFSRLQGDKIVVDKRGKDPILRTIAKAVGAPEDVDALEWALLDKVDTGTRDKLKSYYYDFKPVGVPRKTIEEMKEKYNL